MKKWIVPIIVVLVIAGIVGWLLWRSTPQQKILGRWAQADRTTCSFTYPSGITFTKAGTYRVDGFSPWWRGGSYSVKGKRIRMETTDGTTSYAFTLDGDRLTFTNAAGCTFSYERE
jgi:hypothetical protein